MSTFGIQISRGRARLLFPDAKQAESNHRRRVLR
jgi:hypothetical protein